MIGDKVLWAILFGNIWMSGAHWVLGFFVGGLVYLLTLTMCLKSSCFQKNVGVFSTRQFSLLVALLCAVVVHILEDYILDIF